VNFFLSFFQSEVKISSDPSKASTPLSKSI
jgi:hypothetical protein